MSERLMLRYAEPYGKGVTDWTATHGDGPLAAGLVARQADGRYRAVGKHGFGLGDSADKAIRNYCHLRLISLGR